MRIAMFSPVLGDAFGQERVMRDSIDLLRGAGHEVILFGDTVAGTLPVCERVYAIEGLCGLNPLTEKKELREMHERVFFGLQESKPDIAHFIDQFDARLMARIAKTYPTVLTAHTVAPTCPSSQRLIYFNQVEHLESICSKKSGWSCLFYHKMFGCLSGLRSDIHRAEAIYQFKRKRDSLEKFKKIIAISEFVRKALIEDGFAAEKVVTLYNPVSALSVPPLPNPPSPLIVCASRLVELKGIDFLIHALKKIEHEKWTLWICGDGPLRPDLINLVGSLNLNSKIFFKGRTDRVMTTQILSAATLVVQPNIGPEGFGLTVAEAQSLGKPVIAFRVPALDEIIQDEETGLLANPKSVDDLSFKIDRLLKDPGLCQRFGTNAKQRIQNKFSPENHLKGTLEIYRSLLNETVVPNRKEANILSMSAE